MSVRLVNRWSNPDAWKPTSYHKLLSILHIVRLVVTITTYGNGGRSRLLKRQFRSEDNLEAPGVVEDAVENEDGSAIVCCDRAWESSRPGDTYFVLSSPNASSRLNGHKQICWSGYYGGTITGYRKWKAASEFLSCNSSFSISPAIAATILKVSPNTSSTTPISFPSAPSSAFKPFHITLYFKRALTRCTKSKYSSEESSSTSAKFLPLAQLSLI